MKRCRGATELRNCSTVIQSGTVITGEVIAADTGTDLGELVPTAKS